MAKLPIQPPPGVVLSKIPNIRGYPAVCDWINEKLDMKLPLDFVRMATRNGEILFTKYGNAKHYSTQDIFNWIMSKVDDQASA